MAASTGVLEAFRAEVGEEGPVAVVGGQTQWDVGGAMEAGTRLVRAPAGVVSHEPAEMIVRVRAGTTVAELDEALAAAGQFVPLDPPEPEKATVGGALAVGRGGARRLRWGPVRDAVLEVRYVSAAGRLVKGGAPVVKNVSGFDMCRLLTGSLGTLGLLAEVVLRTQPRPAVSRWFCGPDEPEQVLSVLYRPSSVLWDGLTTWVLLEGHPGDVSEQAGRLDGFRATEGPPPVPSGARRSLGPVTALQEARRLPPEAFLLEAGLGILHLGDDQTPPGSAEPPAAPLPDPAAGAINLRLKALFDPAGRLNPGRRP